ncbi:MAG: autotransporter outer membrane beta-barrel domain-containing protein [Caulobacteraceae bacterium]
MEAGLYAAPPLRRPQPRWPPGLRLPEGVQPSPNGGFGGVGDLSTTSTVTRTAEGDWSGYDLSGHIGAGLQLDVSKHLFFQPKVYADVFHVHEFSYNERNGGPGYDFNVSSRDSTQTNGTASLVTGLRFGNQFVISPQLEVGYDKVVSGGPGATTARFAYGGPTFSVPGNRVDGAAMGRITLRGDGNYVHFSLQGGGEYSSSYHSMDLKAVFRLTF